MTIYQSIKYGIHCDGMRALCGTILSALCERCEQNYYQVVTWHGTHIFKVNENNFFSTVFNQQSSSVYLHSTWIFTIDVSRMYAMPRHDPLLLDPHRFKRNEKHQHHCPPLQTNYVYAAFHYFIRFQVLSTICKEQNLLFYRFQINFSVFFLLIGYWKLFERNWRFISNSIVIAAAEKLYYVNLISIYTNL